MFSRMGSAAYKKDLHNIRTLCAHLDHPERAFKSIHVGGTNGKGSVSHMLAGILTESGYATGLYTSPHLYDFRERIRVDGRLAEEAFVVRFVEGIRPLIEAIAPSFFEITVAMSFAYFREKKVDVAVIEVGLGGRLDSTNIITPELSIITNIGWDHMNLLGDTLPAIAAEKAGIIKKNVPVVIGEKADATAGVFEEKAAAMESPLLFADDRYEITSMQWQQEKLELEALCKQDGSTATYALDLPGIYQEKNVKTVLTAVDVLRDRGWKLPPAKLEAALRSTRRKTGLMGRWEWLRHQPAVILEVAHNPQGVQAMLDHLRRMQYRQLHVVIGMVKDKDIDAVLRLLPREACYYFTQAGIPRAMAAPDLAMEAAKVGLEGAAFSHVDQAIAAALAAAAPDDVVVVCGSIFLVAEVDRTRIAVG